MLQGNTQKSKQKEEVIKALITFLLLQTNDSTHTKQTAGPVAAAQTSE